MLPVTKGRVVSGNDGPISPVWRDLLDLRLWLLIDSRSNRGLILLGLTPKGIHSRLLQAPFELLVFYKI